MPTDEITSAQEEGRHHTYAGYTIPWYVHLLWISFWLLCVYYVLAYLVPALRTEIVNPP